MPASQTIPGQESLHETRKSFLSLRWLLIILASYLTVFSYVGAPQFNYVFGFAVLFAATNLALSLSQLGTKYLNEAFVVTREVRDPVTHVLQMPEDYTQLGTLLVVQMVLGLALPFAAILFTRVTRFRSA